jgi:hypothetical protein
MLTDKLKADSNKKAPYLPAQLSTALIKLPATPYYQASVDSDDRQFSGTRYESAGGSLFVL